MATEEIRSSLRICIVGGGVGGFGTAVGLKKVGFKNVDLYESASQLGDVGAGINVGPNFYRILKRWGIEQDLHEGGAVAIEGTNIRKGSTDEELASAKYSAINEMFQAPIWVCHRADLHRTMVKAAENLGTNILLGREVTSIDFNRTALKYRLRKSANPNEESDWVEYDVIVAADGVKSNIRRQMLALEGEIDQAQDTGQACYRILIPRAMMETDPELKKLIDEPIITRWISNRKHIIAYPISNKQIYNISTAHPDEHLVQESWTSKGSKEDMLQCWAEYCPRIQKMLNMVSSDEVLEWKLRVHHPLKTWILNSIVLIGDASHPTLPHLAQGAAQACEDAATFAVLFSHLENKADIPALLALFEKARKERAENIVDGAYQNGKRMHLSSGKDQEERDAAFRRVKEGGPNPDKSADPETQKYLFGYDCMAEAEKLYQQEWKSAKA